MTGRLVISSRRFLLLCDKKARYCSQPGQWQHSRSHAGFDLEAFYFVQVLTQAQEGAINLWRMRPLDGLLYPDALADSTYKSLSDSRGLGFMDELIMGRSRSLAPFFLESTRRRNHIFIMNAVDDIHHPMTSTSQRAQCD